MATRGKIDMFTRYKCSGEHVSKDTVHYRLKGSQGLRCILCHPLSETGKAAMVARKETNERMAAR